MLIWINVLLLVTHLKYETWEKQDLEEENCRDLGREESKNLGFAFLWKSNKNTEWMAQNRFLKLEPMQMSS